jgi:hypothetical protein
MMLQFHLAFLKGDRAGMELAAAQAKGKPGAEDWVAHSEALVEARSGHLRAAAATPRRATDLVQRAGQREQGVRFIRR